MKRLFTILLICFSTVLFAQPCLPEGITFSTQEQIDSFQVNYPGCSEIEGSVYIQGIDINNLTGLYLIEAIGGDLIIGGTGTEGTSLTDLNGLYYLTSIGGSLIIENNPNLISLVGMVNLPSVSMDSLSIVNNPILSLCDVQSICNYLETPNAQFSISNNAPGCDNGSEVIEECENNCLPGGIYFSSQAQIDSFEANFPGCEDITGFVTIEGDDISTLEGLKVLNTIHGRLLIGSLYPGVSNINLYSLSGLENLTYIGAWLGIYWNFNLTSCIGLNNLSHIGHMLTLLGNADLINMNGFESLTSVGKSLEFRLNYSLNNLSGLENLTFIGEDLNFIDNEELINLTGLESITHIGGELFIKNNPELNNLNGLNNNDPISLEETIYITDNELLTDIIGLENISMGSVDWLHISENPSLSTCEAQNICDYLADSSHIVEIYNNAPGCNSPEEVYDLCWVNIEEEGNLTKYFEIYPTPTSDFFNIEAVNCTSPYDIEIRNLYGQLVRKETDIQSSHYTMNVSDLKAGIYFYVIKEKGEVVQQGKLIKK